MDELQKILTPDLYRANLFRILNLPVTATAREVQRREARRQMEARLGIQTEQNSDGPLALTPPPSEEQIKAALERLHSPVERFLAELFWFWPSVGPSDEALVLLAGGKTDEAEAIKKWTADLATKDRRITAQHNLAVLYHMLALDDEARLAGGTATPQQGARVQTLWQRALGFWHDVHADPDFWVAVTARAAALNDVRLSEQLVLSALEALPPGLLRINARLAFTAAERSDPAGTQRHLHLLGGSQFEPAVRNDAVRSALEPLQERIRQAIESAKANWSRTPQRANLHVRTMHASCKRLLSIVDAVLGSGTDGARISGANPYGALRDSLHDMVADAMRDGEIVFAQKTDDWTEAAKLIELALEVATGGALRSRLTELLSTLRDNAKSGNDWCAPGYWDLPDATVATLEEARERARKGDFDGALARLVPLDVSIGRPLRRAAAYCLCSSAIRINNAALSEFNKGPPTRRELLDKVARNPSIILQRPNPSTAVYMKPPCPLCGKTYYTRWFVFTLRDVPMWLCDGCGDKEKRETEDQRATLRQHLSSALERMVLADELDPGELGVTQNLRVIKKLAGELNCGVPGTKAIKARLDPDGQRETKIPYSLPSDQSDTVCYFCRRDAPSPGCDIAVPVCGDVHVEQRLLGGRSTSVKVATVSVPRCQDCRDAHAERNRWESDYKKAVRGAGGRSGRLEKLAPIVGALICLAIGFAAQDGRAGVDLSAIVSTIGAEATPMFELVARALPIAFGLLMGGTATAWLIKSAKRKRAKLAELFLAKHPEPRLAPGIQPESAYLNFPKLKDLLRQKWSFGHIYRPNLTKPTDVKGLTMATA